MSEIWLPIVGYGDAYSVSNTGLVKRTKPKKERFRKDNRNRAGPFRENFIRSFINRGGYPQVRIGPENGQKTVCVHRLVAIAFVSNPLRRREVNHKDGVKTNNHADNLEWSTRQENLNHAVKTGLLKITLGEESPNAKLTSTQVYAIRADTRLARIVATEHQVHTSLIYLIRKRKIWNHLP